jgi:hypothetical protein
MPFVSGGREATDMLRTEDPLTPQWLFRYCSLPIVAACLKAPVVQA